MKDKLSCEIIQDLLPSYIDRLTSDYTRDCINDHLNECSKCQKLYNQMTFEIENKNIKERKLNHFKSFLTKVKKKNIFYGFILAIITSILLWRGYDYITLEPIVNVPSEDITINEVYQLSDGRIHIKISKENGLVLKWEILELDNEPFIIIQGYIPIIKQENSNDNKGNWVKSSYISAFVVNNEDMKSEITKIYFQGSNKEDLILIWEKGMAIPNATEEIEKFYEK